MTTGYPKDLERLVMSWLLCKSIDLEKIWVNILLRNHVLFE